MIRSNYEKVIEFCLLFFAFFEGPQFCFIFVVTLMPQHSFACLRNLFYFTGVQKFGKLNGLCLTTFKRFVVVNTFDCLGFAKA